MFLNKYLSLFAEKPPKSFGKYAEGSKSSENVSKPSAAEQKTKSSSDTKKDGLDLEKVVEQLFFKEKAKSSGGGSGRPIGGSEGDGAKGKLFTIGMIGAAVLFATVTYYTYAYQEINWKEFTR